MNSLPLISVVIPTYNSAKYLVECLDSVKNQTYPNLEVLIIDGNSTDGTIQIISEYLKNFNWHLFETKKGVSRQRNVGLKNFKGEFVFFLDSDDYFDELFIEKMYSSLVKQNLDIVTPIIKCVTFNKKDIVDIYELPYNIRKDIDETNFFIDVFKSYLAGPTKLYKREMVEKIYFDEKLSCGEDHLFNFKIAKKTPFKFGICKESTYFYRKIDGTNPIEKRLDKSSTLFLKKLLKIIKKEDKRSINYKDGFKLLKDDTQQFITNFINAKKHIPNNLLTTRIFLFLNDHSVKRWFYIFPKFYLKRKDNK